MWCFVTVGTRRSSEPLCIRDAQVTELACGCFYGCNFLTVWVLGPGPPPIDTLGQDGRDQYSTWEAAHLLYKYPLQSRAPLNLLLWNLQSKRNQKSANLNIVKRTIKFLSVAFNCEVARAVLQKTAKAVISAIPNVTLNASQGVVDITPHLIFF